jgi:hypothetical protein
MKRTTQKLAACAGMIGSLLFVSVFVLEDLLDPHFDWLGTSVSEHALGDQGWIQVASFILVGLLFLAFSRGVAGQFREGTSSKVGPWFLRIIGVCIVASGLFVTDPAPITAFSRQSTWHGTVHAVVGAIAFTLMPLSCFAFYRRFRADLAWRTFGSWTLVACITIVLAIVLLKGAQLGLMSPLLGLFQRTLLVSYFGWIFAFAASLRPQPQNGL